MIKSMRRSSLIKIAVIAVIIASLIVAYFLTPLKDYLSIDHVVELTNEVPSTPITALIFLLVFFFGGTLLVPIPLVSFAVSLVFGVWMSLLISISGFFIASLSGYFVGRLIDTEAFGQSVQKHVDNIKDRVEDKGAWAVLAFRLAPTPPFTITSIVAGAIRINIWKYAAGSTLGIMPLGLSTIFFGRGALEMMQNPSGIAASALVAAVLLFILYKVIKPKATNQSDDSSESDDPRAYLKKTV